MTAQLFFSFMLPQAFPSLRSPWNVHRVNGIRVVECECGCSFRGEIGDRCVLCGSHHLKVVPNYCAEDECE